MPDQEAELLAQLVVELKRIADRLEAWDVPYTSQAGRTTHSIRMTANVYDANRR